MVVSPDQTGNADASPEAWPEHVDLSLAYEAAEFSSTIRAVASSIPPGART